MKQNIQIQSKDGNVQQQNFVLSDSDVDSDVEGNGDDSGDERQIDSSSGVNQIKSQSSGATNFLWDLMDELLSKFDEESENLFFEV